MVVKIEFTADRVLLEQALDQIEKDKKETDKKVDSLNDYKADFNTSLDLLQQQTIKQATQAKNIIEGQQEDWLKIWNDAEDRISALNSKRYDLERGVSELDKRTILGKQLAAEFRTEIANIDSAIQSITTQREKRIQALKEEVEFVEKKIEAAETNINRLNQALAASSLVLRYLQVAARASGNIMAQEIVAHLLITHTIIQQAVLLKSLGMASGNFASVLIAGSVFLNAIELVNKLESYKASVNARLNRNGQKELALMRGY